MIADNAGQGNIDKIEQQGEHFEKVSAYYYAKRQSKNHLLFKELLWGYFFSDKSFLKKEGLYVLEPMCGYAEGKTILERHLNVSILYDGFDYSETFVDLVKSQKPYLNIVKMDVMKFEPAKKYDLIILIGGLHHVYDKARDVVNKIAAALKEGGHFINFEPTYNNWFFKRVSDKIYRRNSLFDQETERRFELRELNELYLSNNFKIIDQIYPGLLSYVLYYNPDAFPRLNIGGEKTVRSLFNIDKLFFRNVIGRRFSFATLTLMEKVHA